MTGRDPHESHRAASPLELLFDLSFVIAIGAASGQFAHAIAAGHIAAALLGFAFAMYAICWAWINFSWFASAYDTDDWIYRLTTMVQIIGVIVLALGLPALFESIEHGEHLDNRIMVVGYVIMRVALVAQWLRAAKQDPERRATAISYVKFILVAQVGWIVVAFTELPLVPTLVLSALLYLIEMGGPVLSERKSSGTPWHAHHIAERYGLFAIIALGEGLFGTIASVSAIVEEQSWSMEAILIVVAGVGLTFGLWWNYFILPSGPILHRHRERSWVWGYGHMFIYSSIAAVGAGLHVAAYVIEDHAEIGNVGAVLSVVIPVFIFCAALFAIFGFLVREFDRFHISLMLGATVLLGIAVAMAFGGVSIGWCLVVVTLAPAVIVVGYETVGHRHEAAYLERETT
ncbi:low temperature requirement protein A [Glaciihabitans arcticus]|uniref:Low temperature requirement protein A n=2 Tax=Glaciihabitans arcticus TaxID=2668039 RepID=A0A4Q9GY97_9MICO|nr:low temperature requirement protein A [Glaciihabitans arcticus]